MSEKGSQIECPCCHANIRLNPLNLEVQGFDPPSPEVGAEEWQEKVEKAATVEERSRDAFSSALDAERSREKDLDDLFRKASDQVKKRKDDDSPDHPQDDRWR